MAVLLDVVLFAYEDKAEAHGHQQQRILGDLEGHDLRGDGGPDVCTQDHADGL